MKNLTYCAMFIVFSLSIKAQNTNVKTETTTTIKNQKDVNGNHKTIKSEVTKEVQNIELEKERSGTVNIPMKDSPVQVTTTTKITNPDGTTRTVDIDRSSYYEANGNKYKLDLDASGYVMTSGDSKPALLRKTSNNSYIYRFKNKIAVGYFDTNGDLILETYDNNSDKVSLEKYKVLK
jgi:hypothetical protein